VTRFTQLGPIAKVRRKVRREILGARALLWERGILV
jgi:hypothetical protein